MSWLNVVCLYREGKCTATSTLSGGTSTSTSTRTPIARCLRQWGLFYRCHGDNRKNKEWNMVIINAPNNSLQEAFAPQRCHILYLVHSKITPMEFLRLRTHSSTQCDPRWGRWDSTGTRTRYNGCVRNCTSRKIAVPSTINLCSSRVEPIESRISVIRYEACC